MQINKFNIAPEVSDQLIVLVKLLVNAASTLAASVTTVFLVSRSFLSLSFILPIGVLIGLILGFFVNYGLLKKHNINE